jgi:Domain of unknown function (DUF5664)
MAKTIEPPKLNSISATAGRKFDGGKPEYGLIPPYALDELAVVLTIGAQKYERENWRYVPEASRRYYDALQRHLWAWKRGEKFDPETGRHHLAHAACCLFFLYEHDIGKANPDI